MSEMHGEESIPLEELAEENRRRFMECRDNYMERTIRPMLRENPKAKAAYYAMMLDQELDEIAAEDEIDRAHQAWTRMVDRGLPVREFDFILDRLAAGASVGYLFPEVINRSIMLSAGETGSERPRPDKGRKAQIREI